MKLGAIAKAHWDRVTALGVGLVGLVLLLLGWLGASDTSFPAEQIPYVISGGLFGLCAVAIAVTLWVSADLRDEWRKLDELKHVISDHTDALFAGRAPSSAGAPFDLLESEPTPQGALRR